MGIYCLFPNHQSPFIDVIGSHLRMRRVAPFIGKTGEASLILRKKVRVVPLE
jgi:hypothetical protein